MNITFFFEIFLIIILYAQKRFNKGYLLLVALQFLSLIMAPFVAQGIEYSSFLTFVNLIFVCINLYLIISPWRFANFASIKVNENKLERMGRYLCPILSLLLFINILVFIIVLIYIPDISQLKNEKAFTALYESIPLFSIFFRMVAVTQYLGLIAVPFSCYFIYRLQYKKAIKYFILSLATLSASLAFYSRAGILTFVLTVSGFLLLTLSLYQYNIRKKINKYIKKIGIAIICIFITITVVRFNAMPYYGDRIPSKSIIQDPIAYNILDYASQGFTNGIEQLEFHNVEDIMWGNVTFYNINQILAFFGIINWSSDTSVEALQKAYDKKEVDIENDAGAFHGYVCTLVKDFGYFLTFIINLLYYQYVKNKCKRKIISLDSMVILIFLFVQPCVSIFYASYGEFLFALVFYLILRKV